MLSLLTHKFASIYTLLQNGKYICGLQDLYKFRICIHVKIILFVKGGRVSNMDGMIVSNSIYSLKGTDLRIIYSLLTNVNLRHLVSFNVGRLFSREHNKDYVNYILEAANEFNHLPDETIQVSLFQEMNKILSLDGMYYEEPYHIEEQCDRIVKKVHQQYIHQEKPFLAYTKEQVKFTNIHHMIRYQLRYLFYELEDRFQDLSAIDQEEMIHIIYQYIHHLPDDKKWLLQQRLPILALLKEGINEIELSTLLIELSNVSLSSFFQMLYELLHQYVEKLSMNIPLLHNNEISPTIKLLTSPYFITPNVLGGRVLQMNYQHHAIKKRLLPFILMEITMPYLCNEDSVPETTVFLDEWKRRIIQYRQLDFQATLLEMKHIEISEDIHKCRQRIHDYELQKNQIEDLLQIEIHKIKSSLNFMDISELTISESFEKHRAEYFHTRGKLNQLALSKREDILESSFIKQVTSKLLNMSVTLDQFGKEKKVDELLELLVMDIVDSNSDFKRAERFKIKQIQKELEEINELMKMEYRVKSEYQDELMKLNKQSRETSIKLKDMENDNYGLKEVVQQLIFD